MLAAVAWFGPGLMNLSIRARLTLWYCSIVVVVLVTAAIAGSLRAQFELALQRLDDDLARPWPLSRA